MSFLLSREAAAEEPGRVLIVQTCNPNLLDYVIDDALRRWPAAELSVLLQRNMRQHVRLPQRVRALDNPELGQAAFARGLRGQRFDLVAYVSSGEPGFYKLKLLPLYLDPPRLMVYDRHARPTDLGLAGLIGQTLAGIGLAGGPRRLLRRLLAPLIATALLINLWYERVRRVR